MVLTSDSLGTIIAQASRQGNPDRRYLAAYTGSPDSEAGPGFPLPAWEDAAREADGLSRGSRGQSPRLILERVAKRSEGENLASPRPCPAGVITGSCDNGHRFAKEVYCGREWCLVCNGPWVEGGELKPSHARRFARWYEKAAQIDKMGYWTFTIPEGMRYRYRSKRALAKLGHDVQELLKSFGYERGLRRWHFFGDKSQKWHPHLNVLVDGGLLGREPLLAIRRAYSELLGVSLAIAEYHYLTTTGEMVHALKYVTRATFLNESWDPGMARALKGFRNQLWWGSGRWDGPASWSLDDLPGQAKAGESDADVLAQAALGRGDCPHDGLPIVWGRFQSKARFWALDVHDYGGGYAEYWIDRVPPHWRDGDHFERTCWWRGQVDQASVAVRLPPWYGRVRELERYVREVWDRDAVKIVRDRHLADGALLAEVDELVKNHRQTGRDPGDSTGRD